MPGTPGYVPVPIVSYPSIDRIPQFPGLRSDIPFPSGLSNLMSYVESANVRSIDQMFGPPNLQFEVGGFVGEFSQSDDSTPGSDEVVVKPLVEEEGESTMVIKLVPRRKAEVLLRECVITKLISDFAYSNSEFVEKMHNRRAALIPQVFAFVLMDEFVGMVMTKFDTTLSDYLNYEVGELTERALTVQVSVLIYQIVNTLKFLEQIGFGHCDLKSNNVMLHFDPELRMNSCGAPIVQAALIDFGMSHIQFGSTPVVGMSKMSCAEYIPGRDILMIIKFISEDLTKVGLSQRPHFLLEFLREILKTASDNFGITKDPERLFWRELYIYNQLRAPPRPIHYHSTNDFIKFMSKWTIESHVCGVPEEVTQNEEKNMRIYLSDERIRGWEFPSTDREEMPAFGKLRKLKKLFHSLIK